MLYGHSFYVADQQNFTVCLCQGDRGVENTLNH